MGETIDGVRKMSLKVFPFRLRHGRLEHRVGEPSILRHFAVKERVGRAAWEAIVSRCPRPRREVRPN